MAGRLINTLIVFRILKMLTTPWEKTDAFKLGLIDKNGNRNKAKRIETSKEKDAMSMLHKLVFNLKRLVQKVPLGKSQLASYAVALALLKEGTQLSEEQANELCEDFYKWLKEEGHFSVELLDEAMIVGKLKVGEVYNLRRQLKEQNDKIYPEKSTVEIMSEHSIVFGVSIYVGNLNGERVLVTEEDMY